MARVWTPDCDATFKVTTTRTERYDLLAKMALVFSEKLNIRKVNILVDGCVRVEAAVNHDCVRIMEETAVIKLRKTI
jgi:hypothetical protein